MCRGTNDVMRSIWSAAAAVIGFCAVATRPGVALADCASGDLPNIRAELVTAERALEHHDYRRANDLAKAALAKIGNRYFERGVIDDSGQKLSLADWQETQRDFEHAANIRVRMAHSRADALARKSGC
jgi:hypothetical protein